MSKYGRKIIGILGGRVARNIYFWALLAYTRTEFSYTATQAVFTAILFLLFILLFYTNNLVLIPKYLSRKKYSRYFFLYTLLTAVVSMTYVSTLKLMLLHYPSLKVYQVSPVIFTDETPVFTISVFINEWWPYFLALFIAGCVFAMSWFVMDYQRQQKLLELANKERLEMELSFLKSQVNPHFLFNTLNNLYTLTVKKSDTAPEVVSKISSILRYMLYESDTPTVSFEREKDVMQAYIDLELLRIVNTADMAFTIKADKNHAIPPLLWLPVLENIFKHGTRFINSPNQADFHFVISGETLHIYSCNIFKQEQERNTKGIGINNLTQRLKILYPGRYTMETLQDGNHYITDIKINIAEV